MKSAWKLTPFKDFQTKIDDEEITLFHHTKGNPQIIESIKKHGLKINSPFSEIGKTLSYQRTVTDDFYHDRPIYLTDRPYDSRYYDPTSDITFAVTVRKDKLMTDIPSFLTYVIAHLGGTWKTTPFCFDLIQLSEPLKMVIAPIGHSRLSLSDDGCNYCVTFYDLKNNLTTIEYLSRHTNSFAYPEDISADKVRLIT